MNWIDHWNNWRRLRKERHERGKQRQLLRQRAAGFGWALSSYYIEGKDFEEIACQANITPLRFDPMQNSVFKIQSEVENEFDIGASQGLSHILAVEPHEYNKNYHGGFLPVELVRPRRIPRKKSSTSQS